jgi:F-type H+-transporting ATPase subunit delta
MIVASRYAKALLDLAVEQKQLDAVYGDMQLIKHACEGSRELQLFLKSPVVKPAKKIETLKALFFSHVSKLTAGYLTLVVNKKRTALLQEIAGSFVAQYKEHNNITTALITSAVKLDDSLRKKALSIVKGISKGEVELVEKVNPELIGGFILKVGDRQVDNSVSRQLNDLKKNFNTKSVSIN